MCSTSRPRTANSIAADVPSHVLGDGLRLRQRVVDELKTTFASHYTQVVSLQEMLQLSHIAVYGKRATGEKYLINPNKG